MVSIKKFRDFMINESSQEEIIRDKLVQVESQLRKLFNDNESNKKVSDAFKRLQFGAIEFSKFSKTYKNLKLFFEDENFRYDVTFSIDIKDATATDGQEFDEENLKECKVVFVRYNLEGETLEGESTGVIKQTITKESVDINSIDESFFEDCFAELDEKYPVDTETDDWELELGEDDEAEDSNK